MHRDLKADIQKQIKSDALEIQKALDLWRHEFNTVRPHEKLGMKCPGDVYQKSERVYTSEKTQNRVSVILQGTETLAFGLSETGSQQYLY